MCIYHFIIAIYTAFGVVQRQQWKMERRVLTLSVGQLPQIIKMEKEEVAATSDYSRTRAKRS